MRHKDTANMIRIKEQVEEEEYLLLHACLTHWKNDRPDRTHIAVERVLSRGNTRAITIQIKYRSGGHRVHSILKIDASEQIEKETAAYGDLQHLSGNFFCKMKTRTPPFRAQRRDGTYSEEIAIIEFENAAAVGVVPSVSNLLQYIQSQINSPRKIEKSLTRVLDDFIQPLKLKLYGDHEEEELRTFEKVSKHLSQERVQSILDQARSHASLPRVFHDILAGFEPAEIMAEFEEVFADENTPIFNARFIHGDLNPTNVLVYRDHDRYRGILIDFPEMFVCKKTGFLPYFWDFARLEAELLLSLLETNTYLEISLPHMRKFFTALARLEDMNGAFEGNLNSIYRIMLTLRKSFFKRHDEWLMKPVATDEGIRAFLRTLHLFYIFYLKYQGNRYEENKVPLALYFARLTRENLQQIDDDVLSAVQSSLASEITRELERQRPGRVSAERLIRKLRETLGLEKNTLANELLNSFPDYLYGELIRPLLRATLIDATRDDEEEVDRILDFVTRSGFDLPRDLDQLPEAFEKFVLHFQLDSFARGIRAEKEFTRENAERIWKRVSNEALRLDGMFLAPETLALLEDFYEETGIEELDLNSAAVARKFLDVLKTEFSSEERDLLPSHVPGDIAERTWELTTSLAVYNDRYADSPMTPEDQPRLGRLNALHERLLDLIAMIDEFNQSSEMKMDPEIEKIILRFTRAVSKDTNVVVKDNTIKNLEGPLKQYTIKYLKIPAYHPEAHSSSESIMGGRRYG